MHDLRLVMSRVALLVGIRIVIGSVVSMWASKFRRVAADGVEPRDPVTFIGTAATLAAVGAVAGWLPAGAPHGLTRQRCCAKLEEAVTTGRTYEIIA
jgi:hypothetical protein